MPSAAPSGLLRVNRGADATRLDDLLTFMSNAILKSSKEIFWMQKPSKFNVPGWNERAKRNFWEELLGKAILQTYGKIISVQ